ncbi:MAG: glycosyltransferase, partial [Gammaproteobacteria bacterium]|nr:glycosyltransferase [Gammaproteobacteria bacterium]
TPNVTTNIGAEAMSGDLPWSGKISYAADEFAGSAIELYNEQDQWQQFQKNGFNIIQTVFNKQEHGDALINRISDYLNTLDTHRLENFTGAMLRHHHHKSTEYMAQWIESKNKLADLKLKSLNNF